MLAKQALRELGALDMTASWARPEGFVQALTARATIWRCCSQFTLALADAQAAHRDQR